MHTVPAGGVLPRATSSTSSASATTRRSRRRNAIWRSKTAGAMRLPGSMKRASSSAATLWYMRMIAPSRANELSCQRMRITFVLPHAGMAGGIRVLALHASGLQRRGHQVFAVSLPQERASLARKLKSLARGRGWPPEPEPEPSWFDGAGVPHRVLERARPVVDADVPDADVVLATFWHTGPWVAALSPAKGAKAI